MKDDRVDQVGDSPWARICALKRRRSSAQADLNSGGDFSSLRRGRDFDGNSGEAARRGVDEFWEDSGGSGRLGRAAASLHGGGNVRSSRQEVAEAGSD
ncbi:hypothetical protein M6B38_324405 [Iris pallida]|uniref:Uncharacterized protein n=1 Tax=Iris pallida TaxID=29817 RepID=A0AAX6H7Y2_IRIPA|nr:hypothetical protein M6B38_324405 [Iris pallida]